MIRKKSDIVLLILLSIIMFFLFFLRLTPGGAKKTYSLRPEQITYQENKANDCNIGAIEKLIAHYAVNDNKAKYNMWRKEEQSCLLKQEGKRFSRPISPDMERYPQG